MSFNNRYSGRPIRAIKDPESVVLKNSNGYYVNIATGNLTKDSSGNYYIAPATDYGAYFSWGNTDGHRVAGQTDSYSFSSSNYQNTTGYGLSANYSSGNSTYDAARARLGGNWWRIPTYDEWTWMLNNLTWTWKASGNSDYGVAGYEIKGSASNSGKAFLPAAGYYNGTSLSDAGSLGYYWSTGYYSSDYACRLRFSSSNNKVDYYGVRYYGFSVRPIKDFYNGGPIYD